MDPAAVHVVFNGIFHEVRDGQGELHLVHIGLHVAHCLQRHLDVPELCLGPQPLQDLLQHGVHVHRGPVQNDTGTVHFDKIQKVVDDLRLTVDLLRDVVHEFLVELHRDIVHAHQGIRQNTDRGDRRLQLMGDVGDELISGLVRIPQPAYRGVQLVGKLLCDQIGVLGNALVQVAVGDLPDGSPEFDKGPHDQPRHHNTQGQKQKEKDTVHNDLGIPGVSQLGTECFCGGQEKQDPFHRPGAVFLFSQSAAVDRRGLDHVPLLRIVGEAVLTPEAPDHLRRHVIPPLRQLKAVADHAVILIDQENAAVVSGGSGIHLSVETCVPLCAPQITGPCQPGGKDQALILDLVLPPVQKGLAVDFGKNSPLKNDRNKSDQQNEDHYKDPQPYRRKLELYSFSEHPASSLAKSFVRSAFHFRYGPADFRCAENAGTAFMYPILYHDLQRGSFCFIL